MSFAKRKWENHPDGSLGSTGFDVGQAVATDADGSAAAGRMDLLSVVLHELGHVLGMESVWRFSASTHRGTAYCGNSLV